MAWPRPWLEQAWAVFLLLVLVQSWWALWDLSSGVSWTQLSFYYVLLGPGLLYVAATILIPRRAEPAESWEEHFFLIRRPFLIAVILFAVWGTTITWLLRDLSLLNPYRANQAITIGLMVVGLLSESRRLHSVIPFLVVANLLLGQVVFRLFPDAFTVP